MAGRLEATLFGTLFRVSVIRLSQSLARSGIHTYGTRDWSTLIRDIALGTGRARLLSEVRHTLGQDLVVERRIDGVVARGSAFGMEIFHRGRSLDADGLGVETRTPLPEELMGGAAGGDLLGVFRARCEGSLFFRWDDADAVRAGDIALTYEQLAPLLNRTESFELVTDITWRGVHGRRRLDKGQGFVPLKPIFHTVG